MSNGKTKRGQSSAVSRRWTRSNLETNRGMGERRERSRDSDSAHLRRLNHHDASSNPALPANSLATTTSPVSTSLSTTYRISATSSPAYRSAASCCPLSIIRAIVLSKYVALASGYSAWSEKCSTASHAARRPACSSSRAHASTTARRRSRLGDAWPAVASASSAARSNCDASTSASIASRVARVSRRKKTISRVAGACLEATSGWRTAFTTPTRSYGDRCEENAPPRFEQRVDVGVHELADVRGGRAAGGERVDDVVEVEAVRLRETDHRARLERAEARVDGDDGRRRAIRRARGHRARQQRHRGVAIAAVDVPLPSRARVAARERLRVDRLPRRAGAGDARRALQQEVDHRVRAAQREILSRRVAVAFIPLPLRIVALAPPPQSPPRRQDELDASNHERGDPPRRRRRLRRRREDLARVLAELVKFFAVALQRQQRRDRDLGWGGGGLLDVDRAARVHHRGRARGAADARRVRR
eukprot:18990-Pelagococcus_subviridis.AAC.1